MAERQQKPRLDRREFLRVLTGSGLLLSGGLLAGCGGNDPTSNPIIQPPITTPTLTSPRTLTIPGIQQISNLSSQRCQDWCWAACAEMIVRQFGINVSNLGGMDVAQEYFAAKIYGNITPNLCQPATAAQAAYALTDTYHLAGSGAPIALQGFNLMPIPAAFNAAAVQLIQNQIPFMILLNPAGSTIEHFLLVYSLTYQQDQFGNVVINSFDIADPLAPYYSVLGVPPFPTHYDYANIGSFQQQSVAWAQIAGQAPLVKMKGLSEPRLAHSRLAH